MTTRSLTLIQAVFMALLISLVPAAARSQQQEQPGEPTQEKTTAEPSQQKPAETTPERQQGEVIIPEQGKQTPEKAEAAPPKEAPKEEGENIYTIRRGDTLWDISNAFLKDPFLWPFIWKANPYITNPDLIYPGNKLVIPSLAPIERALEAPPKPKEELVQKPTTTAAPPAKPAEEEQAAARKLILPEEAPVPIIDKYSMLNAGFVNQEESRDKIVGSKEGKTIFGYDDIVYVTIHSKEAAVGDKFIIYLPLNDVKHPVTGRFFGTLIKVLGVLELTEQGAPGTFAARITLSFDAAQKGSMLTPYQEPALIYNTPQEKPKDITGYILEVLDGRTINAQTDIVYLDKGSADGVDPGDRFIVYAKPKKRAYPKEVIGEAQVFLVKDRTSTAVIVKSANFIAKGDEVASKK